jgi:hypothetical protein
VACGQGWTGQAAFGGALPSVLVPDYQTYLRARLWRGFAFVLSVEDGKLSRGTPYDDQSRMRDRLCLGRLP